MSYHLLSEFKYIVDKDKVNWGSYFQGHCFSSYFMLHLACPSSWSVLLVRPGGLLSLSIKLAF